MRNYRVKCNKCDGYSDVSINEQSQQVTWRDIGTVISARLRLDNQWGWQCICGNNNIMTKQEKQVIKNYSQPTPQEINDIKKNLEIKVDNNFGMVGI